MLFERRKYAIDYHTYLCVVVRVCNTIDGFSKYDSSFSFGLSPLNSFYISCGREVLLRVISMEKGYKEYMASIFTTFHKVSNMKATGDRNEKGNPQSENISFLKSI